MAGARKRAGDDSDPDPEEIVARIIDGTRLTPQHHDGRSVAAVAVAAHEVSHAIQHARGETAFALRWRLARHLTWIERIASAMVILAPVIFIFAKITLLFALQLAAGILLFASEIVIHLVTLPVELDASFAKALPALTRTLPAPADLPAPAACRAPPPDLCGGRARDAAQRGEVVSGVRV
jgi:Zn-dependent membrane protease YugP